MWDLILYTALAILVIFIACFEFYKWHMDKKLPNFTKVRGSPIIGLASFFIGKHSDEYLNIINNVYKNTLKNSIGGKSWFGYKQIVTLLDPRDVKTVLDNCLDKPYLYEIWGFNKSLISAPKQQWIQDRKHLAPTLNGRMLNAYVQGFDAKVKICLDILSNSNGNTDFYRIFTKCMLDAWFPDLQLQTALGDDLYDNMHVAINASQYRATRIWLRWDVTYRLTNMYQMEAKATASIKSFLDEIAVTSCDELREKLQNNSIKAHRNLNFTQKLFYLLSQGMVTEETVTDNMYFMAFAAVDTTATALFNIILLLAIHQEYQEKVIDELREIFETADTPVTTEDISRMVYTEIVIKEALRVISPVAVILRECVKDIELECGTIPKNTMVLLNFNSIHKDPRIWGPNADTFDPDHFLPENISKIHPYGYLVFSGGSRNCVGMKFAMTMMKVFLAYFLRKFKATSDLKMDDIRIKLMIMTRILNENPFRIEKRNFK